MGVKISLIFNLVEEVKQTSKQKTLTNKQTNKKYMQGEILNEIRNRLWAFLPFIQFTLFFTSWGSVEKIIQRAV